MMSTILLRKIEKHPGFQLGALGKASRAFKRGEHGFLHGVFGACLIAQLQDGKTQHVTAKARQLRSDRRGRGGERRAGTVRSWRAIVAVAIVAGHRLRQSVGGKSPGSGVAVYTQARSGDRRAEVLALARRVAPCGTGSRAASPPRQASRACAGGMPNGQLHDTQKASPPHGNRLR
jgi:hypothetical protein